MKCVTVETGKLFYMVYLYGNSDEHKNCEILAKYVLNDTLFRTEMRVAAQYSFYNLNGSSVSACACWDRTHFENESGQQRKWYNPSIARNENIHTRCTHMCGEKEKEQLGMRIIYAVLYWHVCVCAVLCTTKMWNNRAYIYITHERRCCDGDVLPPVAANIAYRHNIIY